MTLRTLPGIMRSRPRMARLAVRSPCRGMVESGIRPGAGVVAGRALAVEMVGRFIIGVTGNAVGGAGCGVIKGGIRPRAGVVASRALAVIMVGWFVLGVTANAVGGSGCGVVESGIRPRRGIVAG